MTPHRTDPASLVFGLLFLGVAVWWLLATMLDIAIGAAILGWICAVLLVGFGTIGILIAVRRSRRRPGE